jgi:PAS domain S-box-containing protein
LKIAQNMTLELLHSNQMIAKQIAKDEAILASIGEGMVVTDKEGTVIKINPIASQQLQYKEEELIGKIWGKDLPIITDRNGQRINQAEYAIFTALTESKQIRKDYFYSRADGSMFPVTVTAAPVIREGEIEGGIVVFRDITKEHEIDQAKTEFVSLASHQLRTPLSAINWCTELLLEQKLDPDSKKYIHQIHHSNQRMLNLINALLNVSRLEMGTFAIKSSPLHLQKLAKITLDELQPEIIKKNITITQHYPERNVIIFSDSNLVKIVLQNLLSNAIKYTPTGGTVTLSIGSSSCSPEDELDSCVLMSVQDTGYGIPLEAKDKIFQKLFRADNVKSKDTDGTGLGLYLIKTILDQFGGKIWFSSRLGVGTTFYVQFPKQVGIKESKNF